MMGVEEGNRNGEDAGITSNGASQLLSLFNTPDHPSPDTSQEQKEDHHAVNSSLNLLEAGIQKKKEGIYVFPEKPVIRHERQRTFVTSNQSKLELIASNDHFNHIQKESANVLRNQTSQSYSESHPSYIHDAKNTFDKTPSTLETESLLRNEQKQSSENQYSATTLNDLFTPPKPSYDRLTSYSLPTKNSLAYGNEKLKEENTNVQNSEKSCFFSLLSPEEIVPTLMASVVFLLYHLVFALALASAISASISSDTFASPLLCPLAKMAVLSSIFGGPGLAFIFRKELPSLYPCLDLFLVPFLTQLAQIVDETIRNNYSNSPDALSGDLFPPNPMQYSNLFLNTFAVLSGLGMFLSGILCILGSKIKLANLGGFLPNAVLCGFFSSVGITLWTSAFSVDTGGLSVQDITSSNLFNALLHHLPSLCVGILIFWIGSKYMIPFVLLSIMIVYCIMAVTQTSLEAAQELGWFWTQKDFNYDYSYGGQIVGFTRWSPPFPLGVIHSIWALNFDAQAVQNGIPTVFAMAFIYAIRCSLHAPALIKNKPKILSIIEETDKLSVVDNSSKENVLIREVSVDSTSSTQYDQDIQKYKRHKVDVLKVLRWYGNMHILSGVIGGFACMPSIGAAPTITKLGKGAEKTAPQYGSVALLLLFYLTNFKPVSYIPKIAFSSLLVLSFLDLMNAWFLQSYKLTKDKYEWLVVPAIILFSFLVGMLASVALGVAISTFIFVGSFYKTGVVKFIDTGLLVRSTVERNAEDAAWLDQNGDLIQIMVLQNYLFFGNSSSCLKYISSMFEDVPIPDDSDFDLPPIPKYLVIDFSICSGMDTSAVSVFGEVIDLCEQNNCKAIFAGMSRNLKEMMKFGGVIESKKKKHVFISTNLESALGNAEDSLLSRFAQFRKIEYIKHHKQNTSPSHGFFFCIKGNR